MHVFKLLFFFSPVCCVREILSHQEVLPLLEHYLLSKGEPFCLLEAMVCSEDWKDSGLSAERHSLSLGFSAFSLSSF